jgi:hypothetical protein
MHYVGVAIDASSREVRMAFIDENLPSGPPEFRKLGYGDADLPLALRDLHAAVQSTLNETPARAVGVRRQDSSVNAVHLRTATIDRFLAEGAVLAAARDSVSNVAHISGADVASRLGAVKAQALAETKALLESYGQKQKWADALMVARSLL